MAIGAHSYGSVAEVAALVPKYTSSGSFGVGTRPTEAQVEKFIDRVSGIVNVLLAEQGFSIPVSQADAKLALDELVVEAVIDLCHAANSAGRFFTDRSLRGQSPLKVLRRELDEWIEDHAAGLENLGATRTTSKLSSIGYRSTDNSGDDTFPIFQREAFGNTFTDWDPE